MITKDDLQHNGDFKKMFGQMPVEAQNYIKGIILEEGWSLEDARSAVLIYLAWLYRLTTDVPVNMQQIFKDGVLTIKTEAAKIKGDEAKAFAVMVDKLVAEWQVRIDVVTRKQISANATTQTIFSDFAQMLKDRELSLVAAADNFTETMIKTSRETAENIRSEIAASNKQACDLVKEQLRNDERDHLRSINFDLETAYRTAASTTAELTKAREKLSNITTEAAVMGLKHAEAYYKKTKYYLITGLVGGLLLGCAVGIQVAAYSFNTSLENIQLKSGPAAVVGRK